jgi:hypothetical protein
MKNLSPPLGASVVSTLQQHTGERRTIDWQVGKRTDFIELVSLGRELE